MRVLISAAEASSDTHGAQLLKALKAELRPGERLEAFGIGGPRLRAEGLEALVPAEELLAMGSTEILSRLPRILRALKTVQFAAAERRPDVAVLLDYPDFHFRLARKLKALSVPLVYYIPPKVWVWRKKRLAAIRELFSRVLVIFPFEEKLYRENRIPVKYVGNPLVDELPLSLSRHQARSALGLSHSEKVLALLPGSRPGELKRHLPDFLTAAARVAARLGTELTVLVSLPQEAASSGWTEGRIKALLPPGAAVRLRVLLGRTPEVLAAGDAGVVKSGTVTLEAGLFGIPHVVVYRASWLTTVVFEKFIRRKFKGPVGLVNLFTGWQPGQKLRTREIILSQFSVEAIELETFRLLTDAAYIHGMKAEFARLKEAVTGAAREGSPSHRAAREVLEVARAAAEVRPRA